MKDFDKVIGYIVMAIVASFVIQAILPFLCWCLVGWFVLRAFEEYQKHKR